MHGNSIKCPGNACKLNGWPVIPSQWRQFKRFGWHCKAVSGNSKVWHGTSRQFVEVQSNGFTLQESSKGVTWHCKGVCGNPEEWPGTLRQCTAIHGNVLALQGSVWKFKSMAWHCKAMCLRHRNSLALQGYASKFSGIPGIINNNALTLLIRG